MSRRCASYQASSRRRSTAGVGARDRLAEIRRHGGSDKIRDDFVRTVQRPEPALDLARAALLVAAESDPRVDVDGQLHTLDSWAAELRGAARARLEQPPEAGAPAQLRVRGAGLPRRRKDYYSPSNSLLHEVMERRLGIPLTLSIIFMELGWRIGIPFEGVGFPGHFLVRLTGEPRDLLLDPVRHARTRCTRRTAASMLREVTGGRLEFDGRAARTRSSKRDMIARLLLNLKGAYLRANQDEARAGRGRAPAAASIPRTSTRCATAGCCSTGCAATARRSTRSHAYLAARPDAADRATVEGHVDDLRRAIAELN